MESCVCYFVTSKDPVAAEISLHPPGDLSHLMVDCGNQVYNSYCFMHFLLVGDLSHLMVD